MKTTLNTFRFKSCSRSLVADAYGVSVHVLKKWLEPISEDIGICISNVYTPKQIRSIVDYLGTPEGISKITAK